jgi:hypothetical protein
LYKVTISDGFDKIDPVDIKTDGSGEYKLLKVILDDYILVGAADTITHDDALPTYYPGSIFWEEADTLFVNDNMTGLDIVSTFRPAPPKDGEGSLTGTFFEDDASDGGRSQAKKPVKKAGATVRRAEEAGRGQEEIFELVDYKFTDDLGQFSFSNLDEGEYWINLIYPGYPMDSTTYIKVTIGSGLTDRAIMVEADVTEGDKIAVRQLIILGWEEAGSDLQVYPNPTANALFFSLPEGKTTPDFVIASEDGKTYPSKTTWDAEVKGWKVDVSSFPSGLYILKVKRRERTETLKFVIE